MLRHPNHEYLKSNAHYQWVDKLINDFVSAHPFFPLFSDGPMDTTQLKLTAVNACASPGPIDEFTDWAMRWEWDGKLPKLNEGLLIMCIYNKMFSSLCLILNGKQTIHVGATPSLSLSVLRRQSELFRSIRIVISLNCFIALTWELRVLCVCFFHEKKKTEI